MGNLFCLSENIAHVSPVVRDFCPFPDYSPGPLYSILSANSSQLLSEHYAAVQASLTSQQQQDFTRTLRSTFGKEGKVSHGGMGVVALSLAVLFDTVARQVKGQYVSDREPIPGLFLKSLNGSYVPPVYTVSKYLRLVPYIANNPSRMAHETERYLEELDQGILFVNDALDTAEQMHDNTVENCMTCQRIGMHIKEHLWRISNKSVDLNKIGQTMNPHRYIELIYQFNCDPKAAGERFMAERDSFGSRTKEAFEKCDPNEWTDTVIADIAWVDLIFNVGRERTVEGEVRDFDLKASALGKWI